jgi:energy-converting hydrogenase Eha subunit G
MGYGSDPFALTGLMLGIGIPALLFSLYIDNVAVCERTKIFDPETEHELVTVKIITAIWFFVVSGIIAVIVSVFGAFLWGAILGSRFTQFIEMNLTQQQEVFSHYTLTDWQALIGPEGIIVTALVFGFVTFLLVPILFIFKYECYLDATDVVWDLSGERDEKGRHFRL